MGDPYDRDAAPRLEAAAVQQNVVYVTGHHPGMATDQDDPGVEIGVAVVELDDRSCDQNGKGNDAGVGAAALAAIQVVGD